MVKIFSIYLFFIFVFLFCLPLEAEDSVLEHDGTLRLYVYHLNQWQEISYEKNGQLNPDGIHQIKLLMKSRDQGDTIDINLELIYLLDHLQDHFQVDTVEIISGYRSSQFNQSLKEQGRNVAENSNHIKGIASDIHLDEITELKVFDYVKSLKKGGVGYYPDLLMVHVDLGTVKTWQEGTFSDRLNIGIFNDQTDIKMTTDHLFYFSGNQQKLTIDNPSNLESGIFLDLEKFYRGEWIQLGRIALPQSHQSIKLLTLKLVFDDGSNVSTRQAWQIGEPINIPYGKMRWKLVTKDGIVQNSNEFYLKRE